jgi:uncharacterized protein (DUF608 family)
LPVKVSLEAYNPFIPSCADDSGFPAAIFHYTLTNATRNRVTATLAWSMFNPIGSIGQAEWDRTQNKVEYGYGQNVNEYVDLGPIRGLSFTSKKWGEDHPRFGSMALMTPGKNVDVMTHWLREVWFTPRHEFWDAFSTRGRLPKHEYGPSDEGQSDAGALGVRVSLKPGESKRITFYLTWYFPNFEKYWHETACDSSCACPSGEKQPKPTWKNHYATHFADALDVAASFMNANVRSIRRQSCSMTPCFRARCRRMYSMRSLARWAS